MIGVLGINHKTASLDVRGLFSFSKEEILPFAEYVQQKSDILEIVVLSTCNRTEIYFYQEKTCTKKTIRGLIGLLAQYKQLEGNFESVFYHYFEIEAVKHLFEVISGMDSIVIGEDQIVNQVKDAYMHCTEAALTDAVLMRLFQKSFETSKRVRTETGLQQGSTSVSYVAVDMCSQIYGCLSDKNVLLVGSGETGGLALQNIKKHGVANTFISNRTYDKAVALAEEHGGRAIGFDKFRNYIPKCDIVIVATSAQNHLIGLKDVKASLEERNYNPQVYIDLSVPRNIDKEIAMLENVKLIAVDDLQQIVDKNASRRLQSISDASVIIDQMAEEYMSWFETLTLRPVIKAITNNMQRIREAEMALYKGTEDEMKFKLIDEHTNRLTQKYIGMLIKNLKEVSKNNVSPNTLKAINDLFMFSKNGSGK